MDSGVLMGNGGQKEMREIVRGLGLFLPKGFWKEGQALDQATCLKANRVCSEGVNNIECLG